MNATPVKKPRLFDGRIEKRLAMSITVYLAGSSDHLAREQAVTENISPHGARVISKRYWPPGEEVILARGGEFPQIGRVIYCEKTNHFCVGIEFPDRSLKWGDYLRT
jgi:hypothetical protein